MRRAVASTRLTATPALDFRHELIDARNRDDNVSTCDQARAELPFGGLDQVGLPAIEPDIDGRLAAQTPDEPVDVAPAVGRLERHLERLAPHSSERAVRQFQMTGHVAHSQPVIRDLEVSELLHHPEGEEDGAAKYRHRDEGVERQPSVKVVGDQRQPDNKETAVEAFAVAPAPGRIENREAARSVLAHRATRTVPVRSIRWSAPSKYVSRLGCAVNHCQ